MAILYRLYQAVLRRSRALYSLPCVCLCVKQKLHKDAVSLSSLEVRSRLLWLKSKVQPLFGEDANEEIVLEEADKYLSNIYNLFGSGDVVLKRNRWNQDFKTGYVWPVGKAYFKYRTIDFKTESDVKYPWDMSRSHHLLILGEAYQFTKDEKYAKKVVEDILDFIQENPFLYSINWTCAMDVAIRAANWIHALALIAKSEILWKDDFERRFIYSLYEHKFFIEHNLEKFTISGNHYVADLAGLMHIYWLIGERGQSWINILNELQNEICVQVLPSGFHYEKSTSYHKLVFEMVLYTYYMLRETGVIFSNSVENRIKGMAEMLQYITQPDGNIPFIGDNDNGRFLPFYTTDYADATALLKVANRIFSGKLSSLHKASTFFEDSQMAVMRKGDLFAIIHNNPLSFNHSENGNQIYGSHTHCDMLSFTLSDGKQNLIVDPGTFCYTSNPRMRKIFRGTAMHNTVCVDDLDQQEQNDTNLFALMQYSFPKETIMLDDNTFKGEYWYEDSGRVIYKHQRIFKLMNEGCEIDDKIALKGKHSVKSYFHLAPGVGVCQEEKNIVLITNSFSYSFTIDSNVSNNIEVQDCEVSPSYGNVVATKVIVVDIESAVEEVINHTMIKRLN